MELNPNLKFSIENPKSKFFIKWCIDNNLPFIETSYCKYNERKKAPNGVMYNTFQYNKVTLIVTNINGLNLKLCKNDCNVMLNGKHLTTLGYKNNNLYCNTAAEQHSKLKWVPKNFWTRKLIFYRICNLAAPGKFFGEIRGF